MQIVKYLCEVFSLAFLVCWRRAWHVLLFGERLSTCLADVLRQLIYIYRSFCLSGKNSRLMMLSFCDWRKLNLDRFLWIESLPSQMLCSDFFRSFSRIVRNQPVGMRSCRLSCYVCKLWCFCFCGSFVMASSHWFFFSKCVPNNRPLKSISKWIMRSFVQCFFRGQWHKVYVVIFVFLELMWGWFHWEHRVYIGISRCLMSVFLIQSLLETVWGFFESLLQLDIS